MAAGAKSTYNLWIWLVPTALFKGMAFFINGFKNPLLQDGSSPRLSQYRKIIITVYRANITEQILLNVMTPEALVDLPYRHQSLKRAGSCPSPYM